MTNSTLSMTNSTLGVTNSRLITTSARARACGRAAVLVPANHGRARLHRRTREGLRARLSTRLRARSCGRAGACACIWTRVN
eukprot:3303490-Pleurochrysis_carterae.AAC.1